MNKLLKFAGAFIMLSMLSAIPSAAQIVDSMTFTTTFAFYVGNAKMPAGTYTVRPSDIDENLLQIEDMAKKASAFIEYTPMHADSPHKATETTFKKYGTTEFLDQLWVAGQQFGMQVSPTKVEQKLAKSGAPAAHSVPAKGK